MPSIAGRAGVVRILEPDMTDQERQALQRSAETLRKEAARIGVSTERQDIAGKTVMWCVRSGSA